MTPHRTIANSYWVLRDRLLAGQHPGSLDDHAVMLNLLYLLDLGVTVFMDLTEEGEFEPYVEALNEAADSLGILAQCQRRPIRQLGVPTAEAMITTLDTIDHAITAGGVVYLHCSDGIGRTGTVVGSYLVRHGMTGFEALEEIARLRHATPNSSTESPETQEQRDMVLFPWNAKDTR